MRGKQEKQFFKDIFPMIFFTAHWAFNEYLSSSLFMMLKWTLSLIFPRFSCLFTVWNFSRNNFINEPVWLSTHEKMKQQDGKVWKISTRRSRKTNTSKLFCFSSYRFSRFSFLHEIRCSTGSFRFKLQEFVFIPSLSRQCVQ